MLKKIVLGSVLAIAMCATSALAADVKRKLSIDDAKSYGSVQDVLNDDVAMYWAGQSHPKVVTKHGVFKTSKRSNGFMKENEQACSQALASALIVFRDRAHREGGNAVIDLKSNLNNVEEKSATEYSCLIGGMMVNVALKGTVVTLP